MVWEIEPRYGVKVYVGEEGDICLKQVFDTGEDAVIVLHPEEAEKLIPIIQAAIILAKGLEQKESENE